MLFAFVFRRFEEEQREQLAKLKSKAQEDKKKMIRSACFALSTVFDMFAAVCVYFFLFCQSCHICVCVCVCVWGGGVHSVTEILWQCQCLTLSVPFFKC